MFSFQNHTENLLNTQRFYYNTFQFYNDSDQPSSYSQDPHKIFLNCHHKVKTTIVGFADKNTENSESREILVGESPLYRGNEKVTMQRLFNSFLDVVYENNYSDFKKDIDKSSYQIQYFPQDDLIKMSTKSSQFRSRRNKENSSLDLVSKIVEDIKQQVHEIQKMEEDDKIQFHEVDYYRYYLSYLKFTLNQILRRINKHEQCFESVVNMNMFNVLLDDALNQIMESRSWSYLLLYVPKLSVFSYYLNPVVISTINFIRKLQNSSLNSQNKTISREVPKVVIINFDGIQTPFNLNLFSNASITNILYITFITDNREIQKDGEEEEEVDEMYSQLLIKKMQKINQHIKKQRLQKSKGSINTPIIMAFPFNLHKKVNSDSQLLGTSEDIYYIFQKILFEELRNFNPNFAVVSYGGRIQINEDHFSNIIKKLTIMTEHKVILYNNLSSLFQVSSSFNEDVQTKNEDMEEEEEDFKIIQSSLEHYFSLTVSKININCLFNNYTLFLKITSGSINLQLKQVWKDADKFMFYHRDQYIRELSKNKMFSYLVPYAKESNNSLMKRILQKQKKSMLANSMQLHKQYEVTIIKATNNILFSVESLEDRKLYKYKKIQYQLNKKGIKIEDYLQRKKKELLMKCLSLEKVRKVYRYRPQEQNRVDSFELIDHNHTVIYLQHYSQVIFDKSHDMIFCINYQNQRNKLEFLYGIIEANANLIKVKPFHTIDSQMEEDIRHISYSHVINQQNNTMYLYWPYKWNTIDQVQCRLLDIQYKPQLTHKLLKIIYSKNNLPTIQQINYLQQSTIVPRYGSTGLVSSNNNEIYIFGGILSNEEDYLMMNSGIFIINIYNKINYKAYNIREIPKKETKIRPKMHYKIQRKNNNKILLKQGYGRQFTNYYNLFSYFHYEVCLNTFQITYIDNERELISQEKPIRISKKGNYEMIKNNLIIKELSQQQYKYKMIRKIDDKAISFVDTQYSKINMPKNSMYGEQYDPLTFKKNQYLFVHSHNSPQLFVMNSSNQLQRRQINLQTISENYKMKQYIFPCEDSITSYFIINNVILILAKSYLYTNHKYTIYEGYLNQIIGQKEMKINKIYEFSTRNHHLEHKAIFIKEEQIHVVGGNINQHDIRQDYIVSGNYKKYVKTIKLTHSDNPQLLNLPRSYAILVDNMPLLYAVALYNSQWYLKVQKEVGKEKVIESCMLKVYGKYKSGFYQLHPQLHKPKVVKIQKYKNFNFEALINEIKALRIVTNKISINIKFDSIQPILNKILQYNPQNPQYDTQYIQVIIKDIYSYLEYLITIVKENYYIKHLISIYDKCLKYLSYFNLQHLLYSLTENSHNLYQIIVEDEHSPLTKYIALTSIGQTNCHFMKVRYRQLPILKIKDYQIQDSLYYYGKQLCSNQFSYYPFTNLKLHQSKGTELKHIQPLQVNTHHVQFKVYNEYSYS